MSHFSDCPCFSPEPAAGHECNCRHRYVVTQIQDDGTEFPWGWCDGSDGGTLARSASLHPCTNRVQVRDRMDGGLANEIIPAKKETRNDARSTTDGRR